MKKDLFFVLILLMCFQLLSAQEKLDSIPSKKNPIIFGDFTLGYTNGAIRGLGLGASIYYQSKNNLFTFRNLLTIDIHRLDIFLFIPTNIETDIISETSFLYGKRFVENDFSYHFSGGISYNIEVNRRNNIRETDSFVGFPLEVGVSWFKSKKKRFGLFYGLVPIGEPTGFGRSIGFKLYGNIAKKSYIGLGITFGLGFHKIYTE